MPWPCPTRVLFGEGGIHDSCELIILLARESDVRSDTPYVVDSCPVEGMLGLVLSLEVAIIDPGLG